MRKHIIINHLGAIFLMFYVLISRITDLTERLLAKDLSAKDLSTKDLSTKDLSACASPF
jgi:hypothetical protein